MIRKRIRTKLNNAGNDMLKTLGRSTALNLHRYPFCPSEPPKEVSENTHLSLTPPVVVKAQAPLRKALERLGESTGISNRACVRHAY